MQQFQLDACVCMHMHNERACVCVCYIKGGSQRQRGTQTSRGHRDLEVGDELSLFCVRMCVAVLRV